MTHTEKLFLFDCGQHNWTDTWFDIFPEEVLQIIYRYINAKTIKRLSNPLYEGERLDMMERVERKLRIDYDQREMINVIEKIPIYGQGLKKTRDNPPNKFITAHGKHQVRQEEMNYLSQPAGCEKLPMKYITKSGQVYVFVSACQINKGGIDWRGESFRRPVSITIEIIYRKLNGGRLDFSKRLEHKDLSKQKVSTLKHKPPPDYLEQFAPDTVRNNMELWRAIITRDHKFNEEMVAYKNQQTQPKNTD